MDCFAGEDYSSAMASHNDKRSDVTSPGSSVVALYDAVCLDGVTLTDKYAVNELLVVITRRVE